MYLDAIPAELLAVTDGQLNGQQHVLLFADLEGARGEPDKLQAIAFNLADAQLLRQSLERILDALEPKRSWWRWN